MSDHKEVTEKEVYCVFQTFAGDYESPPEYCEDEVVPGIEYELCQKHYDDLSW